MAYVRFKIGDAVELVILVWFASAFVDKYDGGRLIADETEVIEILQMHNFLAHALLNL
jgi:hypothetical protein